MGYHNMANQIFHSELRVYAELMEIIIIISFINQIHCFIFDLVVFVSNK